MALNPGTLTRILFRKSDADLATIQAQAEQVAFGAINSISALSQSTNFSIDDAGIILDCIDRVTAARRADPDACGDDLPGASLGHSIRFQPVQPPQGVTWGP